MASAFELLCVSVLLSASLPPTLTQVVIGSSSSFPGVELTKQGATLWPSLPPRGRSDVPVRVPERDRATAANMLRPLASATRPPSTASGLSAQNLSSGPGLTRPTASRPRTDTASLAALSRALAGRDTPTKASTPPPSPTFPSTPEPAVEKPVTEAADEEEDQGSGGAQTAMFPREESPAPMPTLAEEMAQYQPQAQTAVSEEMKTTTVFQATATNATASPPRTEARATLPPVVTQATPQAALTGELTAITAPTKRAAPPKEDPATATSPQTTTTTTRSSDKLPQTPGPQESEQSRISSESESVAEAEATAAGALAKTTNQPNRTAQLGRSGSPRSGISLFFTTGVVPVTRPRFGPTYHPISHRNRSVLLGHPHQAPHSTFNPSLAPTADSPNGTLLYWGDLSRTLAFAWELHVYGSASLFLLLFAGAALGLTLSPATNCPHRGALALANALLFLAGGLRAALFLIDPYGTRKLLPRPAVAALYNLPLHMLVWAQAAVALLSLRVAGVSVLPPTLERPPLVAALAVLQCTLLLAADLLSPALSPVVPVTLQVLSLCWGLGLCLGFLCYVFPRVRCPPVPHSGAPDEPGSKAWSGSRRVGVVLGRVLAVCSVLGALCCGLHVHPTLWLYGLLGDWARFNWGWWLVHFWARLLELAWGFALLLLSSWLFWRPRGREEGGAGDARAAGELPSPGQSTASSHRHTCWSKIVQSLRGKPCRKSESNGVGGGGGGGSGGGGSGEVPNNWAGQERPGADISKSLIRNQNHEQGVAPPRSVKENNRIRNHRGQSAERGVCDGPSGSLLRLQALGRPPQRSLSSSLDPERDASLSLCDFDLRPPSPIDLTRSIDEALHREHLLGGGGSLFHPQVPSPGSGLSQGPWLRRNSDPQLSESSEAPTESSMPLGGSVLSSVPSRQVTAPPTPSHQGHRWAGGAAGSVPSSVSCPVSLRPSRTSTGQLADDGVDDTRPFITPDSERVRGRGGRPVGSRSYLEVSRHDDSASVSSEIIDL